jgi:hypothetical protein
MIAATASKTHPAPTAAMKRPGAFDFAVIIAFVCILPLHAAEPPRDIAKRVAHRESETAQARSQYTYTQSVRLLELDARGSQTGEYRETREVVFSAGERSERFSAEPYSRLKNLALTPEDFDDIRNIQPFVMTEDQLWNYQAVYKGEEDIAGTTCWVLSIRPRQILAGQRLFDGMLWVREDDYSVMRSEGQAVPQIVTSKQENLFPRFATTRKLVNGFWFPALTSADDTLNFRTASIREKLTIRYDDYRRFGAETTITFEK